MQHSKMRHSKMQHSKMQHSTMQHSEMRHGKLHHSRIRHSKMQHGKIQHGKMRHSKMRHSKMRHGDMRRSEMRHSQMQRGKIQHNKMQHSKMRHGEMRHQNPSARKHVHMLAYTTSFNLFQLPSIPFDFIQLRSTSSNLFYSCNNRICLGTIPCKSHLLSKPFHSNPTCLRTIGQSCIYIRTLPHKSDLPSTGEPEIDWPSNPSALKEFTFEPFGPNYDLRVDFIDRGRAREPEIDWPSNPSAKIVCLGVR